MGMCSKSFRGSKFNKQTLSNGKSLMKTWVTLLSLFEDLHTVILEKEQMALVDMLPNPDEEDDVSDKDEDEWEHLS